MMNQRLSIIGLLNIFTNSRNTQKYQTH